MPKPTLPFSPTGPAVTLPALCVGLAILAACVLLPAGAENRRLADERAALAADLAAVRRQSAANDAFLGRVGRDAELDERLAARRSRARSPDAEAVPDRPGDAAAFDASPFALTAVPPPPTTVGPSQEGWATRWAVHPAARGWVIGGGLFLVAFSLIMGTGPTRPTDAEPDD